MKELHVKLCSKVDDDLKEAVENLGKAMEQLIAACEKSPVLVFIEDKDQEPDTEAAK